MNRPVVIIDPLSSGIELAPAFKARGIPVIAVTFNKIGRIGFGTNIQTSDFDHIIPDGPNLLEVLREFDPLTIIPGTESGVPLAESLSLILTPEFANDPSKSIHRLHKAFMQSALEEAGIPFIKTISTSSEKEVEAWIKKIG